MALLTSFIKNAFNASHLIKIFISYTTSVKILKCTFILQNNGYYLKLKRKKINSIDLTFSFYRVYLYFILDLRITKNKHNCEYFILKWQFFILYNYSFIIFKRLFNTSFKLNIVNISRALPLVLHWTHWGTQSDPDPQLRFISQFMQNAEFFPSWLTPL